MESLTEKQNITKEETQKYSQRLDTNHHYDLIHFCTYSSPWSLRIFCTRMKSAWFPQQEISIAAYWSMRKQMTYTQKLLKLFLSIGTHMCATNQWVKALCGLKNFTFGAGTLILLSYEFKQERKKKNHLGPLSGTWFPFLGEGRVGQSEILWIYDNQ